MTSCRPWESSPARYSAPVAWTALRSCLEASAYGAMMQGRVGRIVGRLFTTWLFTTALFRNISTFCASLLNEKDAYISVQSVPKYHSGRKGKERFDIHFNVPTVLIFPSSVGTQQLRVSGAERRTKKVEPSRMLLFGCFECVLSMLWVDC